MTSWLRGLGSMGRSGTGAERGRRGSEGVTVVGVVDEESGQVDKKEWASRGFDSSGKNLHAVRSHPDEAFAKADQPSAISGMPSPGSSRTRPSSAISSGFKRLFRGKSGAGLPRSVKSLSPRDKQRGGGERAATEVAAPKITKVKKKRSTTAVLQLAGSQRGPSTVEILQMAKYLGIDVEGKEGAAYRWIVEEALLAELPKDWQEHKTEEGTVYYYHPILKESSWEHPLDAYYRFLYSKMQKMRRANKKMPNRDSSEQRAKDRELVDLLWAMELEQKKTEVLEASDTSDYFERSSRRGEFDNSDSNLSSYTSRSEHSFLSYGGSEASGSLRSTMGTPVLDGENLPDEVKEIAAYLGINLMALATPVTIEEVHEMAVYLGIDIEREGYLLNLAKMCLQAPLPKGWEIYKDNNGEPFYFNRTTKKTSYRHPADEYFINRVLEDRARHVKSVQEGEAARVSEPWLDFHTESGERFWYNFRTKERSSTMPTIFTVLQTQPPLPPSRDFVAEKIAAASRAPASLE